MSIKNVEVEFSFHSRDGGWPRPFTGIIELGFTERGGFVINAHTTTAVPPEEPRGSYCTYLPISPLDYRKEHSKTSYLREEGRLVMRDDWGTRYYIEAPSHILDTLVAECVANEIPEEK